MKKTNTAAAAVNLYIHQPNLNKKHLMKETYQQFPNNEKYIKVGHL